MIEEICFYGYKIKPYTDESGRLGVHIENDETPQQTKLNILARNMVGTNDWISDTTTLTIETDIFRIMIFKYFVNADGSDTYNIKIELKI